MKNIIVPTDFSPASVNALQYALDMAKAIQASVYLLNSYQVPVTYTEAPVTPVTNISLEELENTSKKRLQQLKAEVENKTEGSITIQAVSKLGSTVDAIEELAQEVTPFVIVMGSHGASGLERLLLGSTTITTIQHIKYPVIIVPPDTSYNGIKKIGLACDFKNVQETIPVEYIRSIVKEFDAELHVMNVDHNYDDYNTTSPAESAELNTLLGDIKPNYYFLNREDVAEGINEFAMNSQLDVVIVVPKKHNWLEKIFHKSKSKELVSTSSIPIVSIHE